MKIYGEYSIIQGIESPKEILLLLAGPQRSCRRLPHGCLPSSFHGSALAAGRCLFAVVFPCRAATLLQAAAARLSAVVFSWLRAGGWFLWMASSSLAYSFRFVPKIFGAIPKGLHRRRLECLVVGGEGSNPWPTPHFQIANTPQRDKCFINNILQNGSV